ncbi:MAG: PAS domain-containing protein [Candidatus Competibacteraceae bacterium]
MQLRLASSVFDNTAEGIVITDAQQHIVFVNKAFTQVHRLPERRSHWPFAGIAQIGTARPSVL